MKQKAEQIFGEEHSWEGCDRNILTGLRNSKEARVAEASEPKEGQQVKAVTREVTNQT